MKKLKLISLLLVVAMFFIAVAPSTVEAAPPPAYDADGNRVDPPPFTIKEAELPASSKYDQQLNKQSKLVRSFMKNRGWIMHTVVLDSKTRVYTYEKIVQPYETKAIIIYQCGSKFYLEGYARSYSQIQIIWRVLLGRVKVKTYIY